MDIVDISIEFMKGGNMVSPSQKLLRVESAQYCIQRSGGLFRGKLYEAMKVQKWALNFYVKISFRYRLIVSAK